MSFATHPWFVCEGDGEIDRWEVWQAAEQCRSSWGHVHKDLFPALRGMVKYPCYLRRGTVKWKTHKLYTIEGETGSEAHRMVQFIRSRSPEYAFRNQYRYWPGPNSNTYAQWIVDSFDQFDVKLPWSFIGKRYKRGKLINTDPKEIS